MLLCCYVGMLICLNVGIVISWYRCMLIPRNVGVSIFCYFALFVCLYVGVLVYWYIASQYLGMFASC